MSLPSLPGEQAPMQPLASPTHNGAELQDFTLQPADVGISSRVSTFEPEPEQLYSISNGDLPMSDAEVDLGDGSMKTGEDGAGKGIEDSIVSSAATQLVHRCADLDEFDWRRFLPASELARTKADPLDTSAAGIRAYMEMYRKAKLAAEKARASAADKTAETQSSTAPIETTEATVKRPFLLEESCQTPFKRQKISEPHPLPPKPTEAVLTASGDRDRDSSATNYTPAVRETSPLGQSYQPPRRKRRRAGRAKLRRHHTLAPGLVVQARDTNPLESSWLSNTEVESDFIEHQTTSSAFNWVQSVEVCEGRLPDDPDDAYGEATWVSGSEEGEIEAYFPAREI